MKNYRFQLGQSLVELILAMALSVVFLPALIAGLASTREGKPQQNQRIAATTLLKEAQEAVRVVREAGWSAIAPTGTFHPAVSGTSWSLSPNAESLNGGLNRSIVVSDVYRDAVSGAIVASGGVLDPSTKRVVADVSWSEPYASSVTSTFYVSRFLQNSATKHTTDADFNGGTLSNVAVQQTFDGEVILGPYGWANWCTPNLSIQQQDLPKNGVANALMAQPLIVYAGTGDNSSGISFARVDISDTHPPVPSLAYTYDGFKTNGVFGDGHYGYLATDNNAKEIDIIDLTSVVAGKYQEVGWFNAAGSTNADRVFVVGNIGYMTQDNIFRIFDLTSKVGARPQLGARTLAGSGTRVVVLGNYAYVSIAGATQELQILNISNSANPVIVGQADVNGEAAYDVSINPSGTRAYLATGISPDKREFFIIDTTVKTGNRPTVGQYEANGMSPNGVSIATNNKAILVGSGAEEYQVIDITNEASPTRCGGLQMTTAVKKVETVQEGDTDVFSYIITSDASTELKIIEGGPGGQYALSGTFESSTIAYPNSGSPAQVTLNHFTSHIAKPANTDIQLQIATSDPVGGSCTGAVYSYVGPDGTGSTYFTSSDGATISASFPTTTTGGLNNPTSCIRYKVFLSTTDNNATPVLYDFTLNYSI